MNSVWSNGIYQVQQPNSKSCQAQGTTYPHQVFDLRRKLGWETGYKYCKQKCRALSSCRGICEISVLFSCLRQEVIGKDQCFLFPAMALFHALLLACLKPFKKPSPGSSEGSPESSTPLCSEIAQVMPSSLASIRQFVFHLLQSKYFGVSVLRFSLYRWAVPQRGKFGHSGVLCRAVSCLHQLLQEWLGYLLVNMNTSYLAAQIPILLFCPAPVILVHVLGCWFLISGWTYCSPQVAASGRCWVSFSLISPFVPGFLWESKPHLTGPGKQVTSEIGVRHNPSLLTAEILPGFFDVFHPGALRHLLALYSPSVKVITVVFFCFYIGQLELLKHAYYFSR